jgi:heme A synthase
VNRFAKYSWLVLLYNLIIVLWGAAVRATGSGAGCGNHWPLCNGVVIPYAPQIATIIEFIHRISSGLSIFLMAVLLIWAFRAYPKGHQVRLGASLSVFFIFTEALVGASLVLFGWVAKDQSIGRLISVPVHLVNTFLLLASITLTAWWASGGERIGLKNQGGALWGLAFGLCGVILLGISGSITALADTLYPSVTLSQGLSQDFSASAPYLLRIRVYHPLIAIIVGLYVLFLAGLLAMFYPETRIRRPALALCGLVIIQLLAGLVNVLLLTPVYMQLVHLLLADLLWIMLVILSAGVLSRKPASQGILHGQILQQSTREAGSQHPVT